MQPLGDLATLSFSTRFQQKLETRFHSLAQSMTTGIVDDKSSHLGGSTLGLSLMERKSALLEQFGVNVSEAALFAQSQQSVLNQIQSRTETLSNDLAMVSQLSDPSSLQLISANAANVFEDVVQMLNLEVAGRHLFSGANSDQKPLPNGNEILENLELSLSGATSSSDVLTRIDNWFETAGGGFETFAYQGSTSSVLKFPTGNDTTISFDLRADADTFRNTLKAVAKAVFAGGTAISLSDEDRQGIIEVARSDLHIANSQIIESSAALGVKEEAMSHAKSAIENALERLSLDRLTMIGSNQFDDATEFEAAQQKLDTLYRIAARQSRTSLAEYLR